MGKHSRNHTFEDRNLNMNFRVHRMQQWLKLDELARKFHELSSRDREDGRATWQPQGLRTRGVLGSTSQGARPEDVRKDAHLRGRSRRIMKYPG
jgi:hypothetical protein